MKREEAIKLLNDIHSQCCDTANILCTLDADKRCDALQLAITALQNQPVWIPVSERLPEESLNSVIGWHIETVVALYNIWEDGLSSVMTLIA